MAINHHVELVTSLDAGPGLHHVPCLHWSRSVFGNPLVQKLRSEIPSGALSGCSEILEIEHEHDRTM